jgi:hypothetical protein
MTILVYKDGRLLIDNEQPLEGVSLDNLAAILSGANDGDVIQYDAANGMWVNKSAPSSLPEVTAGDKGKYLKANESTGEPEWASGSSGGGVLYVTASQGMALDKNLVEIQAALDGGKVVMIKRESPSDGVFYCPLIKTASSPEEPYYGVTFYDFGFGGGQERTFSNTTSPTDPLVYEE